ncbi:MAG TPA: peptide-methionine (R)-S-oxide reductase MsrB [Bacteroidia bacterium]|nr:peptide-methionine (R)-S-oxide reductase MsrB [Bacteroidia bacterium]
MKTILTIPLAFMLFVTSSCQNNNSISTSKNTKPMDTEKIVKTEAEWKKELSPEQYHILREKGTEPAYTGEYTNTTAKGKYVCGACGYELFTSDMKFESHCGWPSFDKEIGIGNRIIKKSDYSFGMVRTEIMCARCGGHLGHIFDDGPTETGNRYCVNSLSIKFIPDGKK